RESRLPPRPRTRSARSCRRPARRTRRGRRRGRHAPTPGRGRPPRARAAARAAAQRVPSRPSGEHATGVEDYGFPGCDCRPAAATMPAMTTTIIGVGNLGGTVARHLVNGGEAVVLAAKDESRAQPLADELGPLARAASVGDAIDGSDTVVLAVWLDPLKSVLAEHE